MPVEVRRRLAALESAAMMRLAGSGCTSSIATTSVMPRMPVQPDEV